MSYCVNCGVELDKTCSVCPLCNTKVINPNQPVDTVSPKPYPVDKGYVDSGIRKETAILMAVCLAATAVVCGLLNLFFITFSHWSFYVIGTCIVLWIFCLPIFFRPRPSFESRCFWTVWASPCTSASLPGSIPATAGTQLSPCP